eukprot:7626025-Pyramimonas_sp.AAC.1
MTPSCSPVQRNVPLGRLRRAFVEIPRGHQLRGTVAQRHSSSAALSSRVCKIPGSRADGRRPADGSVPSAKG